MRSLYIAIGFCCCLEVSFADEPPVHHQFPSGPKAVASQVNQRLQELADRISAIPGATTYAYQNYLGSNVTQKVFATSGAAQCGNTETRDYARTTVGANTQIIETHILRAGSTICSYRTFDHLATPTSFELVKWTNFSPFNTAVMTLEVTLNSPIAVLLSTMPLGGSWGSSSDATSVPAGDPGMTDKSTLLGVEDVTLPNYSFTGCLKIHTLRSSATNGLFARMSWYCPNVGLVKQIQHRLTDGAMFKRELSAMTTQ